MAAVKTLSPSSVSMLLRCGERWRRCYLQHERLPPTEPMVRGLAVDAAVEQHLREVANGEPGLSPAGFIEYVGVAHDRAWAEAGFLPIEEYSLPSRQLACRIGIGWFLKWQGLRPGTPNDIQRWLEVKIDGVGVPIVGRADLVLANGTIVDVKTGEHPLTLAALEGSLQMATYALALAQRRVAYAWAGEQEVAWVETELSEARLEAAREAYRRAWRAIQHDVFLPTMNSDECAARRCGFHGSCPWGAPELVEQLF